MDRGIVEQILSAYGITYRRILTPQKGYRNTSYGVVCDEENLNLILYKSEPGILPRIQHANAVGDFVAEKGLPARSLHSSKIVKLSADQHLKYGALYNYLSGDTIPWEAYTMEHIKALGKTMSDMHAVLASFDARDLPDVANENLQLNQRMLRYFADTNVARAMQSKLDLKVLNADFTKLLRAAKKFPNQQALHMDFVRGNILFTGTEITGILDFEKTARGHVVFDIARTLAFLLVDCKYKEEVKICKYFLQSGYIKRGAAGLASEFQTRATPSKTRPALPGFERSHCPVAECTEFWKGLRGFEIQILNELINFFLLHDFYKFLRHNPYQSLAQNHHFVRTKSMLLKRRLIAVH